MYDPKIKSFKNRNDNAVSNLKSSNMFQAAQILNLKAEKLKNN